jgi:two-component system nitrate/nitrite response regulator NarL
LFPFVDRGNMLILRNIRRGRTKRNSANDEVIKVIQLGRSLKHMMPARKKKIRVLLVDDHPSVLQGIRAYLSGRLNIKVVGQALDGAKGLQEARKLLPDVALVDLSLPGMNGVEVLTRMHSEVPGAKLIAYTMHDSGGYVQAAVEAGARGYVMKSSSLATLVRAVDTIHGGGTFLDPSNAASLSASSDRDREATRQAKSDRSLPKETLGLTRREREVLKSLIEGLSTREIARRDHVSFHTAVSHLRNIYNKLGVHKRSAAVTKALREHIV